MCLNAEINGVRMNCSAVPCPSLRCLGTGQFAAPCSAGYTPTHCETCRGPCDSGFYTEKNCTATSDRLCTGCSICPPGKTKIGGCKQYANTLCGPCANGTYYKPTVGLCDTCPAGYFVPPMIPASDDCSRYYLNLSTNFFHILTTVVINSASFSSAFLFS
jgi:hypothetical protein